MRVHRPPLNVAVVGGGRSGSAIERALLARGMGVKMFSRSSGFNVLHTDATHIFGSADVIVEATSHFTLSHRIAIDFFTRSTRNIANAARATGARHVLLSIVNCELPELQGYGYFAGKAAQERIARAENGDVTIVRSTQWFEFAEQNLDRFTFGPFAMIPQMTLQPVALDAFAEVVADAVASERPGTTHNIAGPEVMTLRDMTQRVRRRGVVLVPLPLPGKTWRRIRDGGLVPSGDVEQVGPRFTEWSAARGM